MMRWIYWTSQVTMNQWQLFENQPHQFGNQTKYHHIPSQVRIHLLYHVIPSDKPLLLYDHAKSIEILLILSSSIIMTLLTLLLLFLTSAAVAYKITWDCELCNDTFETTVCYKMEGLQPFNNAYIHLNTTITTCEQTGLIFPMYYEFNSCGEQGCNITFTRGLSHISTCSKDEGYLSQWYVQNLTAAYKIYKEDENASYDWCKEFIVPEPVPEPDGSNIGLIVGVAVGAVVVVGSVIGGIFYFKKKKGSPNDYQVQV